ncbi:ArsR/SmtB family transcription factor [Alkalicoccobacillus plakortidis]|uniref:Metalloregulator ArsR/SmtB family transcription factor n=1 Tax=Alkalicoccobacillus plakortidis TaxID=444060 RepID=A0ABT0XNJ9_9BACI|nr:metalloregulator ArsR/SmtB family transcription factor [Alkalicoccobacillus plakortidis]MCM2677484.1 metalloregulator ArsR/SmtB family transcription factor [Alkalicoccobacillus plakortidis]
MVHIQKLETADTVTCLKIISDPTRLLILKLVEKKEYCVCQFVEMFETSQPAISQHIKKLKKLHLLNENRRGQWRHYSLNVSSPYFQVVKSILDQVDHDDPSLIEALKKERPVQC